MNRQNRKSSALALPHTTMHRLLQLAHEKRQANIQEALSWPKGGSASRPLHVSVFKQGRFEVRLGKPGKEAEWARKPNLDDMWPNLLQDGKNLDVGPAFSDIISLIETTLDAESRALLGALFVRMAFMLDHELDGDFYRFPFASNVELPRFRPVPAQVYLAYIDAIGWNEDVKYRGYHARNAEVGRVNNMLSLANFIAIGLGRAGLGSMLRDVKQRNGLAPISLENAIEAFPLLSS